MPHTPLATHSRARRLALTALALLLLWAPSASAEDVDEDRYPNIPLSLLDDGQRARFVKIASAELCPCEGPLTSLDACLKLDNNGCQLASQVSIQALRRIKEGESDSDVTDSIVKTVELARKVYDFGDLSKTPRKGALPGKARLTIVEFADFECPYCGRASVAMANIIKDHGDDVTLYFKQFPLPMHKHAELAARASLAAHNQGKFWPMHDWMMINQRTLGPTTINERAQAIGLNMARFKADLDSPAIAAQVKADADLGSKSDLTGTPTFFINGVRFEGSLEALRDEVASRLEK